MSHMRDTTPGRLTRSTARALRTSLLVGAAACTSARAGDRAPLSDAELLHLAVNQLTSVMVYDIFSPPQASRAYAYASIAAYEAMRDAAGPVSGAPSAPPHRKQTASWSRHTGQRCGIAER